MISVPLTEQQEIFIGRTDISARIENFLLDRRRPPLLLYGQRRMGKTSLLYNLGRLLPDTIIPFIPISYLTEPEARQLVEQPVRDFPLYFGACS